MENRPDTSNVENPLLRSGLFLAGANRRQSGAGEDGVLTALEVAGMDLWGTRLVVLSACDTGVGDTSHGEGVYGLRRALVLAGVESQVLTLWQVQDKRTRDLMIDFYRRLQNGEGRTEALRQAQLAMLRGKGALSRHPFFWAGFIQSGDWRAISGR
jgi:CHAT domain-containing protein